MAGVTASAVIASIVAAVPSSAATLTLATAASASPSDPRIAALVQAKATGTGVTVDALTSADSITIANADGTLTSTTTVQPTRMKNAAGSWVDLDATLARTAAGALAPAVTPDGITLSPGGTGPLITVDDHAGHAMSLALPLTLPAPSISGSSATYASIYPGLDLTVTVTTTGGFSEVLTVHDAAALAYAKDLKFTTGLTGLTLAADATGNLNAVDPATGTVVMDAPPAALWDSATATPAQASARTAKAATDTTAATATQPAADNGVFGQATSTASGPGVDAHVEPLGVSVAPGSLTLNADTTSLGSNPDFPLFLDPQWAAPPPVSGGTQAWTQVQSGCPTATYYKNITQPGVGYNSSSGCIGAERAYYQIDSSAVINPAYVIVSSTLKTTEVYSAYNSCGQSSENVSVYLAGPISAATDWNNQPGPIGSAIATQSIGTVGNTSGTMCSGGIVSTNFDVRPLIADARNGSWPNVTLSLEGNESAGNSLERFSDNPTITTVYDIPPGAPTNFSVNPALVNPNAAASVNGCGGNAQGGSGGGGGYLSISNMAGKNAAVLSATLPSAQNNALLYAQFSLYDHARNVWVQPPGTDNPNPVGPNATATYTTPALTDNTCYTWDVTSTDLEENSPTITPTPWSSFFTDFTPPANPSITSSSFPTLASGAPSPTKAGQQGTFTLSATDGGSGIQGYYYSIDTKPVPSAGGTFQTSTTVTYPTPATGWGAHTLYAQSEDNAGNLSAVSSYSFYVPWNPAAPVKPGDINADGIPDLVSTDVAGDLTLLPGNSSPNATATNISSPTDSPDGTSWANFDTTHDGSYEGKGVDDLWSFNASTHSLYLYLNSGTGTFKTPNANNTDVTMQKVGIDVNGAPPTQIQNACVDPTTNDSTGPTCANFDYSDWTKVQQILAPGDLFAGDPVTSGLYNGMIVDNGVSGLLTADTDGSLWYFNGQTTQNYLNAAVQLGTSGWNDTTLIGSDTIGSTTYLWARINSTGAIYQYPITFDAAGNLVSLGTPTSGTGTRLTIPSSSNTLPATAYPQLYAQNLHATGYADLIATTPTGAITDWPGTAPNGTTATFDNPKVIGGAVMTLVNVALNTCLDSNYAGSLYSDACNGGNYQGWIVNPNSDGTWALTDYQTGRCLDGNGSSLYVNPCNGGAYQHWTPTWSGSGWILTSLATGKVIDDNGSPYFNTLNGGPYQQWK